MALTTKLPDDWREWASDDPADHKPGCGCLCRGPHGEPRCVLEYDAYLWRLGHAGRADA